MHDIWLQSGLLLIVGLAAGIINVMAGGGSMLSVPILIFAGLDPVSANATNRVAIAVQNSTAVFGFRQQKLSEFGLSLRMGACAMPGSILGALLASHIDNSAFQRILSIVLIISVIALLVPMRPSPEQSVGRMRSILVYPLMFAIGFYGGFIQVGVGFLFMAGLQWVLRINLIKVNMHKVLIILIYTLPALAVFIWMGQVNWTLGITLAAGNAVGAWIGTRLAVRGGDRWIRALVAVVVVAMAVKLLLGA